jgi:O-antigen/teichoic acid export membrane protein
VNAVTLAGPRTRTVRANATLAMTGDIAAKAAALAVVVISARLLPVAEFARLGVALAALTVATSLLDAGFSTLIVRDGAGRPSRAMGLLSSSIRARAPLAALMLATGLAAGLLTGDVWLGLLTAAAAVGAAASLSLASLFRSSQDLAPEAVQKFAAAALTLAGAVGVALASPEAAPIVGVLGAVLWLSLPIFWLVARRRFPRDYHQAAWGAMRGAIPFGLMTLATLLYYRLGTLLLGAVGTASATADYTIASTIAFGLLLVPNAITTGLLPRLSAQRLGTDALRTARRALAWTLVLCLALSAVATASAPVTFEYAFGSRYGGALLPFVILLAGFVVIGVNGILGTVLIASGRTWILGGQVGASLVVNLVLGIVLVTRLGAEGAALATLATEVFALGFLLIAVHRVTPELLRLKGVSRQKRSPLRGGHGAIAAHDLPQRLEL